MNHQSTSATVSIGTLNIAAAAKPRAERIFNDWIIPSEVDVHVFTETSEGPGTTFLVSEFLAAGWSVHQRVLAAGDRGVLIASRIACKESPHPLEDPAPGRTVVIELETVPRICIVGMYVPNRGNDPSKTKRKREFLDMWIRYLADRLPAGCMPVVIGDLNVVPPSQKPRFLPQEEFEYRWYKQLENNIGLYDGAVGHSQRGHESTWVANTGEGYTYDHIFPARTLRERVVGFQYDHSTRRPSGISDHSALQLTLKIDAIRLETKRLGLPVQGALFG
jgi:exonuclease III